MPDVVDIIHNLSYNVVGQDNIKGVTDGLKVQSDNIERLKSQLSDLNKAYSTEQNVKQQQNLSGAILRTTDAITQQAKAMQNTVAASKPLQQAITVELGLIQKLTDRLNDLRHARERATNVGQIQETNTAIAATKKELNELMNIGGGGSGGGIIASLFGGSAGSIGKQLLTGSLIGLGIGSGLGLVTRAVSGLVEYAEAEFDATKNAEDLKKANEALSTSLDQVGASAEKESIILQKIVEQMELEATGIDLSIQGYKNTEEAVKALGIVKGQQYMAEKNQYEAAFLRRQLESDDLQKKYKEAVYLESVISVARQQAAQAGTAGIGSVAGTEASGRLAERRVAEQVVNDSNLPSVTKDAINLALNEAQDKGANILDILSKKLDEFRAKSIDADKAVKQKAEEQKNADIEFEAKINREVFEKTVELNKQKLSEDEKYRELKEKEDIASVDKIVLDTREKYKALLKSIELESAKTKKIVGEAAFNKKDSNGQSLSGIFGAIISSITGQGSEDEKNNVAEFARQAFFTKQNQLANEAKIFADQLRTGNNFGLPDYENSANAEDAQKKSELFAAKNQFEKLAEEYRKSGQDDAEIAEQYAKTIEQIEQASYSRRLQLASEYFEKTAKRLEAISKLQLTQTTIDILNGRPGLFGRGNKQLLASGHSAVDLANREIPGAQESVNKSSDAVINAKTVEETQVATDELIKNEQRLADIKNQKAIGEKQIHDAKVQQIEVEKSAFDNLVDSTAKGYDTISEARQRDLDREITVRTQRIDIAYKLAERGNTQALAQEQKALDTAQQQKKQAAIQEQEVNAALTVSRLIAGIAAAIAEDNAGALVIIPLILAAAATGFAEASAITASEQKQFFKGGYTGEGGKFDEAGTVHKGEFVFNKETTEKHREFFEAIHKGYEPFPVMGLPRYASNPTAKNDKLIADKLDLLIGKNVNVSQVVDKRGVAQIVKEESINHRIKYSK